MNNSNYKPRISRFKGRDSLGRKNRRIQYAMDYRKIPALVDENIFTKITDAWNKTKSDVIGYSTYREVAELLKMPVGRLMQYIKGMHQQDPYSVTFSVNRMGDNVYFKLKGR